MRTPILFAAASPLLALFVACVGNTGSSGSNLNPSADGGDGGYPSVAQSGAPRKQASAIAPAEVAAATTANNAFGVDLLGQYLAHAASPAHNVLTSPFSASIALTMTYAGARGATAAGMAKALHLGSGASSVFDGQNGLLQAFAGRAAAALAGDQQTATLQHGAAPSPDDYQLQIADSIWGERTYPWADPFLVQMAQDYGAGVHLEDFIDAPETARADINAWVATSTAGKILNLLPAMSIDTTTRMVLVDAIHLKLPWAQPFSAYLTAPAPFTRADATKVQADFMSQEMTADYADDGEAQTVGLPLAGGQLEVLVTVPRGDLVAYESSLTAQSPALVRPTTQSLVALELPKFGFTSATFSLKKALSAMGMASAFDANLADLTGLCPKPPNGETLYISDVLQKVEMAAQETGVEAAAATAVIIDADGGIELDAGPPKAPIPVRADRPFVVSIVDVPTGAVLFVGHIGDPTDVGSP